MKDVVLALIKKDEEIFLIKRKFEPFANLWSFPGGRNEKNESLKEGVIRETKEETDLDITIINKLGYFTDKNVKIHIYNCKTNSTEYNVNTEESLEGGWYKISDAQKMQLIPELKAYLKYTQK